MAESNFAANMATESKRMYSWWWATHISPRNSKWLHENLTDLDSKVKLMIKLIEVDEDSFARRAEMYYKKRPELVKLVEEFFRAYRALAERYDHATGVIRHAHKTISEAFPNQIHFLESDDGSFDSSTDFEASFVSKEAPLSLNFHDAMEGNKDLSESAWLERSEADIKALKESLAKLEGKNQESIQRLSYLESKVFHESKYEVGIANERTDNAEMKVASITEEYEAKIAGLERSNTSMEIELSERNTFLVKSLFDVNVERLESAYHRLDEMESKIIMLQELVEKTKGQLGEELDKAEISQFEIFILKHTLQDTRQTLNLSEKFVSRLEHENTEQKEEVRLLSDQIKKLRIMDSVFEKYDDEMRQMKTVQSQMERELANTKIKLSKKELELMEAEALIQEQGKQIKENEYIQETMQEEQLEVNRIVETLRSGLKMGKDEAESWETIAFKTFAELQNSSVYELLYREKLFELNEEWKCLVDKCNFDGLEFVQQKEKNSQVQAHWDGCTEINNGHNEDITTNTTSDALSDKIKETNILAEEDEDDDIAMKDIMLDQASENSSSRKNIKQTWYDNIESDDQIPIPPQENCYFRYDTSEMPVEKELRVDSLELSKRYTEPGNPESSKKILERLTRLQKAVQDLKETGYADAKEPIKKTEREIMKHIQNCEETEFPSSSIGDHVRKWSEKIGRLEVEVEKIQYLVVKLNASNKAVVQPGKKVALRDYLYGSGAHTPRKARLCGCLQPKTSED
ncbi:hypothetical protein V2J09_020086 [Rumex salicifolius]